MQSTLTENHKEKASPAAVAHPTPYAAAGIPWQAAALDNVKRETERSKEKFEREMEDLRRKREFILGLPSELPFEPRSTKYPSSYTRKDEHGNTIAQGELIFDFTSRQDVMALYEALPPMETVFVQAGTSSYMPAQHHVPAAHKEEVLKVCPLLYTLESWCGSLRETYSWFYESEGVTVNVLVQTPKEAVTVARATCAHFQDQGAHEEPLRTWVFTNLPAGQVIQWYTSGPVPPRLTVHNHPGVDLRSALSGNCSATFRT